MKRYNKYYVMGFLLLILGCRERFEGFDLEVHNEKLVIEAIMTDHQDFGYVRISYTEPVSREGIRDFVGEDNATVLLTNDQGSETVLYATGNGLYSNANFKPQFGTKYQMTVRVGENEYQSAWEQLPLAASQPSSIEYRPDTIETINETGDLTQLTVTFSDELAKRNEDTYYYWQLNHFYIFEAYGQPAVAMEYPETERFCYVQEPDQVELAIHADLALEGSADSNYRVDISKIPFGNKFVYDYSLQVIKYNVSKEIYEYLEQVKNQITNSGSVFDAAPASISGNFNQVSGDLPVLGFFGVFNATADRVFVNQDELPFRNLTISEDYDCPGHHSTILDNSCWNCLAFASEFNTAEKPLWWR